MKCEEKIMYYIGKYRKALNNDCNVMFTGKALH